jgi:site-specific DNA-cytosine methylase
VDISTLNVDDLGPLRADLWLLSPSCQPYTVINPLAKGSADPRAKSFLHLIQNVLPELVTVKQHPHYLLVENVGGFEVTRFCCSKSLENDIRPCSEFQNKTNSTVDSEIAGVHHNRAAFNASPVHDT